MKRKFLIILLAGVSTLGASALAVAQKKTDLHRSVDDNGEQLSIRVYSTINGKKIDYHRSIMVSDLSAEERNDLAEHILDSLGPEKIKAPLPPSPPQPPGEPQASEPPTNFSADESTGYAPVMIWQDEEDDNEEPNIDLDIDIDDEENSIGTVKDSKAVAREVSYDTESGELHLRYQFMKNGEEFIYEKTVNASEKSEKQRQNIILDFEKEIGLPVGLIQ